MTQTFYLDDKFILYNCPNISSTWKVLNLGCIYFSHGQDVTQGQFLKGV